MLQQTSKSPAVASRYMIGMVCLVAVSMLTNYNFHSFMNAPSNDVISPELGINGGENDDAAMADSSRPSADNQEQTTSHVNSSAEIRSMNGNGRNETMTGHIPYPNRTINASVAWEEAAGMSEKTKVEKWWIPFVNSTARIFPRYAATQLNPDASQADNLASKQHEWCKLPGNDMHYSNVSMTLNKNNKNSNDANEYIPPTLPLSGILYVKSHKASSSTCEGINERIAHQVAQRQLNYQKDSNATSHSHTSAMASSALSSHLVCPHQNRHDFANFKWHGRERMPPPASLLWTMVRHPASRDLSQIFHLRVSRQNMEPSDNNIISILKEPRLRGTQARYLMPKISWEVQVSPVTVSRSPSRAAHTIQRQILEQYDFIGVTERMIESLAVLTLLWDLEVTDVLVLSAKRSGNHDAGGKQQRCTKIKPARRSAAIQAFLDSYEDYQADHADFLLYHAVERSLDLTTESLGRDIVTQRADEIRELQALVERECASTAIFPCSNDGIFQPEAASNCYIQDAGCGYPCVDRVLFEKKQRQSQ